MPGGASTSRISWSCALGAQNFAEALDMCARVYAAAGALMAERGPLAGVADEGGYWPNFASNEDALATLARAIEKAGLEGEVAMSLDIAASEFHDGRHYRLALDDKLYETEEWIAVLGSWLSRYPIASIEDPLAQTDDEGMRAFTAAFGGGTDHRR